MATKRSTQKKKRPAVRGGRPRGARSGFATQPKGKPKSSELSREKQVSLRGPDGRYISRRQAGGYKAAQTRARRARAAERALTAAPKPPRKAPSRALRIIRAAETREREARQLRELAAVELDELRLRTKPKLTPTPKPPLKKEPEFFKAEPGLKAHFTRSEAAKKGWETRRRRAQWIEQARLETEQIAAEQLAAEKLAEQEAIKRQAQSERATAAPRGVGGRFATPKQAAAAKRERLRRQLTARKEAEKLAREAAALKGWKTIQGKAKKRLIAKGPGPSPNLRKVFTDPTWYSGGWYEYPDGQQEGQIIVAAGLNSMLRDRLLALAESLEDDLRDEPVWVEVGFLHVGLDKDSYRKFAGMNCETLYPRRAENIGEIFLDQRELADNLMSSGADIKQVVVRVHYGDRPERLGK